MKIPEPDTPSLGLYLSDLETVVRKIDAMFFEGDLRKQGKLYTASDPPESMKSRGARIFYWASFFETIPGEKFDGNVASLPKEREGYMLWENGVARRVKSIFRQGKGDAEIKRTWLCTAIGLVRARVLYHPTWFPKSRKRTLRSIPRFARHIGPSVFSDFAKLSQRFLKESSSTVEIDMQLTQLFVLSMLERGVDEEEALGYIITD